MGKRALHTVIVLDKLGIGAHESGGHWYYTIGCEDSVVDLVSSYGYETARMAIEAGLAFRDEIFAKESGER